MDNDDFWDLAELIPKKKSKSVRSSASRAELRPVEIRSEGAAGNAESEAQLTVAPSDTVEERYTPSDNSLLRAVCIRSRDAGYSFYGQFRRNAIAYLDRPGAPTEYVPFFSYVPQYSQLNEKQLAYYLYFRDQLRCGERPRTDYSYFWLYIYEILNLPDFILPSEGVLLLCRAWSAYREALPKIDKYMTVWLADYCLVHRLPCPLSEIRPFLGAIVENGGFREFYLGAAASLSEDGVAALIGMTSDYRPEKSKYAVGEYAEIYRKHVFGAMAEIFRVLFSRGDVTVAGGAPSRLRREAFVGAISSHRIKCSIEVEYASFSTSKILRGAVTAALKYAENRLRAYLSVKSRLSVPALNPEYKHLIDTYFDRLDAQALAKRREEQRPAYEALYEAESGELSFAGAEEIEALSWQNARLLAAEEDLLETEPAEQLSPELPGTLAEGQTEAGDGYGLNARELAFLSALLDGGHGATGDRDEDALAERINEAFSEHFGDIVLEMTEHGYSVIEDYIDEVRIWIERNRDRK